MGPVMKTTPLALLLAGALASSGCIGELTFDGTPAVEDPLAGVSDPDDPASRQMQLTRGAIYTGLGLGRGLLVGAVNQVLREDLVPYELTGGATLQAPVAPAAASCPFVDALGNDASTAVSCRFLVERARDLTYGRISDAIELNPLGAEFDAADDPQWIATWYRKGTFSGVDGEIVSAVQELRAAGVCDQTPAPVESAEMAGAEAGRALFQRLLDEQVGRTPPTVCDIDGGIVQPAVAAANLAVATELAERPLCGGAIESSETDVQLQFAQAKLSYELGMRAGIADQAVIGAQSLLSTWVCTPPEAPPTGGFGDPLVVDLAGDGVAPLALADGVAFDVTGTGLVTRTPWPAADDALLAVDLDGSGAIESGRELFSNYMVGPGGARFADGFAALAIWDRAAMGGNEDGVIDAADAVFARLRLWRDADRDGVSQAAELTVLPAAGVTSLSLDPEPLARLPLGDAFATARAGRVVEIWLDVRY